MSKLERYQPYVPAPKDDEGNNGLKENTGAGSTEPFAPNGYPWVSGKTRDKAGQ